MPCLVAHQAFSEVTTRHRVQAPWCLLEAISPWLWEQVVGGQMGDYGSSSRGAPRQTNGSPVSASRTPSRLGGRVGVGAGLIQFILVESRHWSPVVFFW